MKSFRVTDTRGVSRSICIRQPDKTRRRTACSGRRGNRMGLEPRGGTGRETLTCFWRAVSMPTT